MKKSSSSDQLAGQMSGLVIKSRPTCWSGLILDQIKRVCLVWTNEVGPDLSGTSIGLWHITFRPASFLYNLLSMGKLESILSSSITAVFFTAFLISALMWYGSAHSTQELFGPTRYSWDNGYYSLDTKIVLRAWKTLPDKLVLYDYIGSNPAKGGLFRSGPMLKGSGIVQNWLGHASFSMGTLSLSISKDARRAACSSSKLPCNPH